MHAWPGIRRPARTLRVLALLCAVLGGASHGPAQAQSAPGDAAAKARFTVTLARFVQWPPGTFAGDSAPLRLCVLHNSAAVGSAFAQLGGEAVAGHPIVVVSNPGSATGCELLFVDASAARAGTFGLPAGLPVLTLGAVDGFLSRGGMVELANVNDSLRFDVSLKAVRQAQLDLSSQVLRLARQVRE